MAKTIDNFNFLKHTMLPVKSDGDTYWRVMLIARRKPGENEDLPVGSKIYGYFTVECQHDLEDLEGMIKKAAEDNNARAYMDTNPKSWKKTAFNTLKRITQCVTDGVYKTCVTAAERAMDDSCIKDHKSYLIDFDFNDDPAMNRETELAIYEILISLGSWIKFIVPTQHGQHYIVQPFYVDLFRKLWEERCKTNELLQKNVPDILKRGLTILYHKPQDQK